MQNQTRPGDTARPFGLSGDLTLLDLVLVVQEHSRSEQEVVRRISRLLESGRVRLRVPASRRPDAPGRYRAPH